MKLNVVLQSQNTPFEGDCIVQLRGLPANAAVTGASARITPSEAEETVSLEGSAPLPWGITLDGNIVDFHARRLVSQARLKFDRANARVRVDMGGLWVALNNDGSLAMPDTGSQDFTVTDRVVDLRGVATARLQVTTDDNQQTPLALSSVTWKSLASNVSLRLSDQGPFLFSPGDLRAEVDAPDFSEALRAYLSKARTENGQYILPIVLHSDTIARLDVVVDIEYTQSQDVIPPAVKEVAVQYTLDPLPQGQQHVVEVMLPANARVLPGQTTARIRGSFAPDRVVWGSTDPVTAANSVRIGAGTSFAQRIQVSDDLSADAIDLYVQPVSRTARLTLTLLDDAGGKPFGPPLMPAASLALAAQPDGMAWKSARLPREFQFLARLPDNRPRCYWLVVQIAEGEVDWCIAPTTGGRAGLFSSQDNHLTWQEYRSPLIPDAVDGLFRLRWTPPLYTVPIQVMVGEGQAAQKVNLDRYQPEGRIDFRMDFPEIAQAFNQYLAAQAGDTCPRVENLANAEFEEWVRIGDTFGRPQTYSPIKSRPTALAVSPGGDRLVIAFSDTDKMPVKIYDGYSLAPLASLTLNADLTAVTYTPEAILIHPDGKLALISCTVSSSIYLFAIDLDSGAQLGHAWKIRSMGAGQSTRSIALSQDGNTLFTGSDYYESPDMRGEIHRYGLRSLIEALQSGGQAQYEEIIHLPSGSFPAALAVAPDGNRLFVITDQGNLYGYQGQSFQEVWGPIQVGKKGPWNLVPIHQGDQLIISDATTNRLMVVDTIGNVANQPAATRSINQPVGLAVTRDERLALVSNAENRTIHAIDIHTLTEVSQASLAGAPGALALNAVEHLVFIASSDPNNLAMTLLPFGVPGLEDWTLTAGSLMPFLLPAPFHLVAVLGAPVPQETSEEMDQGKFSTSDQGLSQVVPITAGCKYAFNFWGLATNRSALAEVLWRSPACGQIRRDEIPFVEYEEKSRIEKVRESVPPDLRPHHATLEAPEGAPQAEIRFSAPAGVAAIIDRASFMPAPALANGNLQAEENGALSGWELEPPAAAGVNLIASAWSVSIRNSGTSTAILKQRLPLAAGQPFQLVFNGARRDTNAAAANPRVEAAYLDGSGSEITPASGLDVETGSPPELKIETTTPAGTAQVEVRLVLSAGSVLEVTNLTLDPLVMVRVPVTFLAQTSGELVVSDFHVAYELLEPTPPAAGAAGLCSATPPGQPPGQAPQDTCYCPCCHTERKMTAVKVVTTRAGRLALAGMCPTCGARLTRVGGQDAAPGSSTVVRPASGLPGPTALRIMRLPTQPAAVEEKRVIEMPGLAAVQGIGPALAQRLEQIGIGTLELLAAAQPEAIAQVPGISREKAMAFIEDARRLRRASQPDR